MICRDCFEAENPIHELTLTRLKEVQEHKDKEQTRLFSKNKQEELFKPYRDKISSLLETYAEGSTTDAFLTESLKGVNFQNVDPLVFAIVTP